LPSDIRRKAEQEWQCPLDQVRLHDDSHGGRLALSLGAQAVTIGPHIYFAPGRAAADDHALLRHELSHVVSQDARLGVNPSVAPRTHPAERAAYTVESGFRTAIPRSPVGVYRSPMKRADFERQMRRFGVNQIFTATFKQQVDRLNYFGAGQKPGNLLSPTTWTAWSPGADSSVYDWIIQAFAGFASRLGGVPAVQELGFFATEYEVDPSSGKLVPKPNVAASYGGGRMAVYETAVSQATSFVLPAGRSTTGAGASLTALTPEQGLKQAITHELGHGLVETAMTPRKGGKAPDASFMKDYGLKVGWTAGRNPQLYDAGIAAVQQDLKAGKTPAAPYRISSSNWNDPGWKEQPVSEYMTTHPSEDLPEAVAVYVNSPNLLKVRSPNRFAFIEAHKSVLAPYLRRDLATLKLFPSEADLGRIIDKNTPPPWLTPGPALPAPSSSGSGLRFKPGPALEIVF